ncbi:hypothetical protein AB0H42_06270 [Nocardia sp. NPDC050799]|uniref:hypothetical protein n=1 Tax=Nocardia sp. NPDC050799 TaxID=3154842 RepID=UPI0033E913DE
MDSESSWREQQWLSTDPVMRIPSRPTAPDNSKAMTSAEVGAPTLPEEHTAQMARGPFTLPQLRHSRLTHTAEQGASTPIPMALPGHTSVLSPAKYAKVPSEALGRWQAQTDPATRRRRWRG